MIEFRFKKISKLKTEVFALFLILAISSLPSFCLAIPDDYQNLVKEIKRFKLENGMTFLVAERPDSPIFNAQTWVKVGSSDELAGKSGSAHLLEHMAFKGTTLIGTKDYAKEVKLIEKQDKLIEKYLENPTPELSNELKDLESELEKIWINGEYTKLLEERGAKGLNAGTSSDYTMYTVSLPSSELEFWFYMESERLIRPVFRQFYKELEVVQEERRMRTEDKPSGKLYEALLASSYWGHPYQAPTIGWKSDLMNLRKKDAEYLHKTYYQPDNMVSVVVGDVDFKTVKELAERYFGRIPANKTPIDSRIVPINIQDGERLVKIKFDSEPVFMMAYHKPTYPAPESAHLSLLYSLLDEGRSSPFQKILIQEKEVATSIYTTEAPGDRYDPVFIIGGTPKKGVSVEQLITEIDKLLMNLELTDDLLIAAKKRIKVQILEGLASNSGLASVIGKRELLWGDWKDLFVELEQVENTTISDIKIAMEKYLKKSNRTITLIENKE